jgi:GrpB-like predicted nucleotidyltransferase (UPF0157 family)
MSESTQHYELERDRLIQALGRVVEGGVIEAIEHIGATSVPELFGSPCIDIGLAVWPFPLEAGPRSRLEALGYQIVGGYEEGPEQRFRHRSNQFQLYFVEPGSPRWSDLVLTRDYLRHDHAARQVFSGQKQTTSIDKSHLFEALLSAARHWWIDHYQFSPVESVANELSEASFPWYISSGWALDLFLGKVNRVHQDVDVVVPRPAQMELRKHLAERGWRFITPFEKRLEHWPPHMQLELPRHQVHAHREDEFIDILLTDMDGVWKYRREPSIVRSLDKIGLSTESGIPYLAPELVLLFKSKNTSNQERTKDQSDFENILPHLDAERRAWLRWALIATSPDHLWIEQLS